MDRPEWIYKLRPYTTPQISKSIYTLINTLVPYFFLLVILMILINLGVSYWIVLLFIPIISCFHIKIFILMHDCSHKSFFKSKKASLIIGHVLGILSFTAFLEWSKSHIIHHATVGNLDKRGVGDISILTVDEYISLSKWRKLTYCIYRNPITLFVIGPIAEFIISQRFPGKLSKMKELLSVIITNIAIAIMIIIAHFTVGIKTYLAVQLPAFYLASSFGIFIFYIQHQFENVYWEHNNKWNIYKASLEGSSHYEMPKILRWFTCNIEIHNLHHLNPMIPSYRLADCYKELLEIAEIKKFTLSQGIKSISLKLWDEKTRKLVSFSYLKKL